MPSLRPFLKERTEAETPLKKRIKKARNKVIAFQILTGSLELFTLGFAWLIFSWQSALLLLLVLWVIKLNIRTYLLEFGLNNFLFSTKKE